MSRADLYEAALRRVEFELKQIDKEADALLAKAPAGQPLSPSLEFQYAQVGKKMFELMQQRDIGKRLFAKARAGQPPSDSAG